MTSQSSSVFAKNVISDLMKTKGRLFEEQKYEAVNENEENDSTLPEKAKPSSVRLVQVIFSLLVISIAAILYLSMKVHYTSSVVVHTGKEFGSCGENPTEALANGCQWDIMSWSWQRPECYHQELIDSFLARTQWHFYSNTTLDPAYELPLDEVIAGKHPMTFAEKIFHPIHCTYMWQKLHRAYINHSPIDDSASHYHHTLHCELILLNDFTHETPCKSDFCPTTLKATYPSCGFA